MRDIRRCTAGGPAIAIMPVMFFNEFHTNPQHYFAVIIVVVVSICLHELAHGFTAIAFGDKTPEETGHITLNPLVHMPPISLVLLFVAGISFGLMPVDPTRMRGKYAEAIVALAGPATNLLLAALGMLGLGVWVRFWTLDPSNHMIMNAFMLIWTLCELNLVMFVFNLIPTPPLDGSRIAAGLIPGYRRMMSDPTMQGVFYAVTMAALFGAGQLIWPRVDHLLDLYLRWCIELRPGASNY